MGSLGKSSKGGSIHRIREFELEKVNLTEEFDILQIVGEGWFGKILLVEHKATDTEMVLKALPKPYTSVRDFYREFHYGLHLSNHKNIISTYDVSFETAGFYVFSQEYAPLGDLTSNVTETGIGEVHTKRVAKQLAAALEHLHVRDLVHRDVKLDNILVFKSDFTRIKLCDFGETRRAGTVVTRRNEWLPYAPPEVLEISVDNSYKASTSHDVWQFAIVIFVCLTGCLPWQKAACDDPRYMRYLSWHTSNIPLKKLPKLFKLVSSKAQKLFKKYLEPKPEKRPNSLSEVHRFMDDRWMSRIGIEKNMEVPAEEEGLCPSMYSFHSSPEEKNKLLFSLTQYGLETTVDRNAKKDRIRHWIQTSVIEEEDEEIENSDLESDEDLRIKDIQTGPVGERMLDRGPVSHSKMTFNGHDQVNVNGKININTSNENLKSVGNVKPNNINLNGSIKANGNMKSNGTLKKSSSILSLRSSDIYTPPIDPRVPLEEQKSKLNAVLSASRLRLDTIGNEPKKSVTFSSNTVFSKEDKADTNYYDGESSNNNNYMEHRINVQLPQAKQWGRYSENEKYASDGRNLNENKYFSNERNTVENQMYEVKNKNLNSDPQVLVASSPQISITSSPPILKKRILKDEKLFGVYSIFGSKSSSSNSNSTGKSTPR